MGPIGVGSHLQPYLPTNPVLGVPGLDANSGVVCSAGRASALQAEGRRFDPVITHHYSAGNQILSDCSGEIIAIYYGKFPRWEIFL